MMNQEDKTLQTLKRENQKKILELNHQLAMENIYLEENKVKAETEQQIQIIQAKETQSVKLIQADTIKQGAERKSKKAAEQIKAEAQAYSEQRMIETNAKKESMTYKASVRLDVAKAKVQGTLAEAEAEASQAANLDGKRKYEQKMKMAEGMKKMVLNNQIVIGGANGEELLNYFKETADLVNTLANE